jgi:diaminohydroxyphosphoribosylaminopyrimidine deaminase/5-amino-6-(5-phosphoribosylamino)uracil reductase
MDLAIKEAYKYYGLTYPNPPVGAVVVKNGAIVSIDAHKIAGEPHAEVNAIKQAYINITNDTKIIDIINPTDIHNYLYENHNNIFNDCDIYVTLEPCNHYGKTPPCALLLERLRFNRVIIGSLESNAGAEGGAKRLQDIGIEVIPNIMQKESKSLLDIFDKTVVEDKPFVFFKYAQSINGTIDGGYLSCSESLDMVHALRDRCDLLIIGGNSVRVDRPTLDARRVDGKAPDILIYSKSTDFDTTIPLFGIKNRKVYISNSLDIIKDYRYIMVEGGSGMLKSFANIADNVLLYTTPNLCDGGYKINSNIKCEYKYFGKSGVDIYSWLKILK